MDLQGNDRRRTQRAPLTTFCPVTFEHAGKTHSATMINISALGAGCRIEETGEHCSFRPGEELTFHVKTPYGDSVCVGKVVWTDRVDDQFRWGIQFVKVSDDEHDPFRCLLDSSF